MFLIFFFLLINVIIFSVIVDFMHMLMYYICSTLYLYYISLFYRKTTHKHKLNCIHMLFTQCTEYGDNKWDKWDLLK